MICFRYNGSSCHVSGSSVDVGSDIYSYSSPTEATDECTTTITIVCPIGSSLNSSSFKYKDDTNLSAVVEDVDIVADIDVDLDQGIII